MSASTVDERFLQAMQESYEKVLEFGVRSNQKTRVLHGWVQDELRRELGNEYVFTGQTPDNTKEAKVSGMYYDKDVDVLIERDGQELGVVSVKFVISNYWQNSVNYFEQQVGETANLRRKNIVYGNLFCVTNPIPYNTRSGSRARLEKLRDHDVQRYVRLRADHEHAHAPDEMAVGIVDVDIGKSITRVTDISTLGLSANSISALENQLSVSQFFRRMALRIELRHISP